MCGYTDASPSPWNGSNHGLHTLCSTCAKLESILVEALRLEARERGGLIPLNVLLNRADGLLEEDLDDARALEALADLGNALAIRVYGTLDDGSQAVVHFVPSRSRRAREALAALPPFTTRAARRASKAAA